jgi:hypothetical protein
MSSANKNLKASLGESVVRRAAPTTHVDFYSRAGLHQGLNQCIPALVGILEYPVRVGQRAFPVLVGLHHDYRRVA